MRESKLVHTQKESTVGVEHEWADVDRHATIPPELGSWSIEDYSIVNSDGHANCPTGDTWRWGGEINTVPTQTAKEQGEIAQKLIELLCPVVNYKCNLHVHVRPKVDLLTDLDLLKTVAYRLRNAEKFVYSVIEPLPYPDRADFHTEIEYKGAIKRWRRNKTSHQYSVSSARYIEMMNAQTVQEFKDAHAPPTAHGGRAWHVVPRAGMNLRSLWKHGTIEFRHFSGTLNVVAIVNAVRWCKLLVDAVCEIDINPAELWCEHGPWVMPEAQKYDHRLAVGFEQTRFKK